jgi:hypothetical protein
MSNLILTTTQQPGASFAVGGGGGPNWASVTNAQISQGLTEFCINEGYRKLLGDIEDLELDLVTFTFSSTAQTYKYAIPPAGYATISHVARVYYKPFGLPYTREFRPVIELTSWAQYQKYTGQGYLLPYSFGTQPWIVTVDPLLKNLYFYPGSAIAGDTITVNYSPLPGIGLTGCPTLVAQSDVPIVPLDCHMAIVQYALSLIWVRLREAQMAVVASAQYKAEVADIRARYTKKTHGDTIRLEAFGDSLSLDRFSVG